MSDMTDYMESGLANAMLRGNPDSWALPTGIYVGLVGGTPSDADPTANELSGNGYARVQVVQGTGQWTPVTTDGVTENLAAIEFPEATADWDTASGVIICDAASGGNCYMKGTISTPRQALSGDTLRFKSGDLSVTYA